MGAAGKFGILNEILYLVVEKVSRETRNTNWN